DRLLPEPHARLCDVPVRVPDLVDRLLSEHHVELREAEDEYVALVDQRDLDVVAERFGETRGQLEAAEAGAEDDHTGAHPVRLSRPVASGSGTCHFTYTATSSTRR